MESFLKILEGITLVAWFAAIVCSLSSDGHALDIAAAVLLMLSGVWLVVVGVIYYMNHKNKKQ